MSIASYGDDEEEDYNALKDEVDEEEKPVPSSSKHNNVHSFTNDDHVIYKLPLFLLNEFYRLSSVLNMDQSDIQLLFGAGDEDHKGNPETDYSYFMNEVIRKIERIQHEGNRGNKYQENDEEYLEEEKLKKQQAIKKQEKQLSAKTAQLQENIHSELKKIMGNPAEDMEELNKRSEKKSNQFNKLLQKYYREKKQNKILEEFIETQNKKIAILAEHIEKLMRTLKIESGKKMHALEELQDKKKEESGLQETINKNARIQTAHEKVIAELREGTKVLEDQLRLMDEKYLELRSKLDVTRSQFQEIIKRVGKENKELRVKYSAANNGALLDQVRLDKQSLLALNAQNGLSSGSIVQSTKLQKFGMDDMEVPDMNSPKAFNARNVTIANPPTTGGKSRKDGSSLARPASAFALTDDTNHNHSVPKQNRPHSATPYSNNNNNNTAQYNNNLTPLRHGHQQNHGHHGHHHHPPPSPVMTKQEKESKLRTVLDKVERKTNHAKQNWSAERLIALLEK